MDSEVSRARVQQIIAKGEVLVNDAAAKSSLRLRGTGEGPDHDHQTAPTPRLFVPWLKKSRSTSSMKMTIWLS